MGRYLIAFGTLLAAAAFSSQTAHAGDRKPRMVHERSAPGDYAVPPGAQRLALREEFFSGAPVKRFETSYSPSDTPLRKVDGKGPSREGEHRQLTFFHFNSVLGRVAVQPVFEPVKGAQFSIGF